MRSSRLGWALYSVTQIHRGKGICGPKPRNASGCLKPPDARREVGKEFFLRDSGGDQPC